MSSKNMSHNVLHNAALFETLGRKDLTRSIPLTFDVQMPFIQSEATNLTSHRQIRPPFYALATSANNLTSTPCGPSA